MAKIYRFLGIFLISCLFFVEVTFAGGSSMSLEIQPKQLSGSQNETVSKALTVNIKTYFSPSLNIKNLNMDNLSLTCQGVNVFSSAILKNKDTQLAQDYFFRTSANSSSVVLKNSEIIENNAEYNYDVDLVLNQSIQYSHDLQCFITNISFYDLDNHQQIFDGVEGAGYVNVIQNEPSTIRVIGNSDLAHSKNFFLLLFDILKTLFKIFKTYL